MQNMQVIIFIINQNKISEIILKTDIFKEENNYFSINTEGMFIFLMFISKHSICHIEFN